MSGCRTENNSREPNAHLYERVIDAARIQPIAMPLGQAAVSNKLIDLGKVGDVSHGEPAEFCMIGHDHHTLRALDHGANRFDNKSAGVADSFRGNSSGPRMATSAETL